MQILQKDIYTKNNFGIVIVNYVKNTLFSNSYTHT